MELYCFLEVGASTVAVLTGMVTLGSDVEGSGGQGGHLEEWQKKPSAPKTAKVSI